jgi:hypothetical protein
VRRALKRMAGAERREASGRGINGWRERRRWGKAERLEVGEGADGRARGVSERGGREGEMGQLGRSFF